MSPRAFTPDQEQKIIDEYDQGKTIVELVHDMGGSTTSVTNVLKRHGILRRSGAEAHGSLLAQGDPALHEEALRLYKEGSSVKTLCERYRCNSTVITALLREAGVKLHPGGRDHPVFRTAESCQKVAEEYAAGASLKGLAKRYGCTHPVITRAILRGGGEMRGPGVSKVWTEEAVNWAVEQYRAGRSQEWIAEELSVHQTSVSGRLRQAGAIELVQRKGRNHHSWTGGRFKAPGGYMWIVPTEDDLPFCKPGANGYVLEHRLVMGRALGRPLRKTETVHHINGDTTNNQIENLQLRQGRHGKGVVMACKSCGSHDIEAVEIAT